ncbi:hypothetical protein HGI30_21470 [Paenibacillus albicereus]|uniref:LppX_LprAFG lipoprotein n=1 Tax=Paenibacillus albicereus TaxID=2726185 RepID=A0A6H2H2D6_9BACL|nr:DUF6612 family protein [Paenibacillus albicereus]QJC53841.1 hypothetical protein HGI30_21470 [Paenibacillus albicereus]
MNPTPIPFRKEPLYERTAARRAAYPLRRSALAGGLLALMLAAGCAGGGQDGTASPQPSAGAPKQAASTLAEEGAPSAEQVLGRAAETMADTKSLELSMELKQDMETDGQTTSMSMTNEGRIIVEPLALMQKTVNDYMGESSTLDSYLTDSGYYMYDYSNEAWSRMLADEVPKIKATLSDFQIAPAKEIEKIAEHASAFRSGRENGEQVLLYAGSGSDEAAEALVRDLLRSTMGLDDMEARVRDSIEVSALDYRLRFDEATGRLIRLEATADVSIEYDPGNPSRLSQTFTLDYGGWNEAEPVVVPEEAKDAPEVMPADQGLLDALGEEGLEELEGLQEQPAAP